MIYAKDRILGELDAVGAQLASLAADLQTCRDALRVRLKKAPPFMSLQDYDCHFAAAFIHIEKAKMAIRSLHPVCHQADVLRKSPEKKRHRK
jgi:hypothetical protein